MREPLTVENHDTIWSMYENGEIWDAIGEAVGRSSPTVRRIVNKSGGKRPAEPAVWSDKRMCLVDRETISRGLVCGDSFRTIATRLDRAPSTVSREVKANGGRDAYRAVAGEASVRHRAKRPKQRRLKCDDRLRSVVDAGLAEFWSPTQISNTLKLEYPDDPTMRASPETIYEAVYRGLTKTKPQACLRTKRRRRVPRHRRKKSGPGRGIIKNRRLISERSAHIEERTELGHWEGDLIIGNVSTAMATLVERMTRYTVLVRLPGSRTMDVLNEALKAVFGTMAEPLIKTLTWDQGKEIAAHEDLAAATGLDVFVCDRSSPWQRGTNENTNGLLRQWWPRSTNFYTLEPVEVCRVQTSLNARPRATLEWQSPTKALERAIGGN